MRPVVKYIKLGEFEVEFQDIFDPSNEKECQLIDTVVWIHYFLMHFVIYVHAISRLHSVMHG